MCKTPATILDSETMEDIKSLSHEVYEEVNSMVTVKKFYSAPRTIRDGLYDEAVSKIWKTYEVPAIVNTDPTEKDLTALGIREQVDIVCKFEAQQLEIYGLFGTDPTGPDDVLNTDDRIVFEGIEYRIYKIAKEQPYRGEYFFVTVTGRIYNKQGKIDVPSRDEYVIDENGAFVLDIHGEYVRRAQ